MSSTYSSHDSDASLAAQLRAASRTPSSVSGPIPSSYASSRLTADNDGGYAKRLASTANAYTRALLSTNTNTAESRRARDFARSLTRSASTTPSSRFSRFASRFSGRESRRRRTTSSGLNSRLSRGLTRDTRELLSQGSVGPVIADLARNGRWGTIDNLHAHLASIVDTGASESTRRSTLPSYRSYEIQPPPYTPTSRSGSLPLTSSIQTTGSGVGNRRLGSTSDQIYTSPQSALSYGISTPSTPPAPTTSASNLPVIYELDSRPIMFAVSPSTSANRPSTPLYGMTGPPTSHTTSSRLPPSTDFTLASTLSNPPRSTHYTRSSPSRRPSSRFRRNSSRLPRPTTQATRATPQAYQSTRTWSDIDRLATSVNSASLSQPPGNLLRATAEYTRSPTQTKDLLYLAHSSDALSRLRPCTMNTLSSLRDVAVQSSGFNAPGSMFSAMSEFAERGSIPAFYSMRPKLDNVRRQLQSLDPMELGEFINHLQDIHQDLLERQQLNRISSR